jgi:DNA-directed RNA polymerase III subunit RPC6
LDEKSVLELIESFGSSGITKKEIKSKCATVSASLIPRILKTLESRQLVKQVTMTNNKKRKVFLPFNLEPSQDITGQIWESSPELMITLTEQVLNSFPHPAEEFATRTVQEVATAVKNSGVASVEVNAELIERLLNTLVLDGKLEPAPRKGMQPCYRKPKLSTNRFPFILSVPCGDCPVFTECGEIGEISPQSCIYLESWLGK